MHRNHLLPWLPTCALEAPALGRLQSEYANQDVKVVAVNIERRLPLERWISFWQDTGVGEVLWGQDFEGTTIRDYELLALGTEIIVDREVLVAFRSDWSAGYERLRSEIQKIL